MAMQIKREQGGSETWSKSTGACTSAEIKYTVLDSGSKSAAIQGVLAAAPENYGGLPFKEVRFDGYGNGGEIELAAIYAKEDSDSEYDEGDEATVNFECGAGTRHVVTAISQKCVYAAPGETQESDAEASAVPIGWNGKRGAESEAAGVDVPAAQLRETYTKVMSRSTVMGDTWKRKIAELYGKVNSSAFNGWHAGEVMFMGASYTAPLKGATKVQVSFHFDIRINETNAKIGNISAGDCAGFEYLWAIMTEKAEDGKLVATVKKIYKSQVVEEASFSGLISTGNGSTIVVGGSSPGESQGGN